MMQSKVVFLDENSSGTIQFIPYDAKIITKEQQEAQKKHRMKKELRKVDERGSFVILNLAYLKEKLEEVTYLELGYAMMLLPYISYPKKGDKFTRLGTEADYITYEKLCGIWGMQPDTVRKLVKKLEANRILTSTLDQTDVRKKVVHFSKRLVVKGDKPKRYLTYTKVYQKQLSEFIRAVFYKNEAAKATGLLTTLLINLNGPTQLLVEDEVKVSLPLKSEKVEDFFARLKIGNKNVMTINRIKELVGITDNRSIKKSLALLQKEGVINRITIDKKKVFIINPTIASKQDSSKFELCGFTLKHFFLDAKVSMVFMYLSAAAKNKVDEDRLQTLAEKMVI